MSAATPLEQWFPMARRLRGTPLLSDEGLFRKLLMGQWALADPARLRLHELGVDPAPWPHYEDHAAQLSGRRRLAATLEYVGVSLAVIWSAEFKDVFVPFVDVLEACPCVADDYTVIYLVSRVEHALSEFANRVFGSLPKPPDYAGAQLPAAWAKLLKRFVVAAAETAKWEAPPTWKFFAYDGEYVSFFESPDAPPLVHRRNKKTKKTGRDVPAPVVLKGAGHEADANNSTATTTRKDDKNVKLKRVCHLAVAEWLKAKDEAGALVKCGHGSKCIYSHDLAGVQALPAQGLSAFVESMKPTLKVLVLKVLENRGGGVRK